MAKFTIIQPDREPHGIASPFHSVVSGVAQGLGRLFPPVDDIRIEASADDHEGGEADCADGGAVSMGRDGG